MADLPDLSALPEAAPGVPIRVDRSDPAVVRVILDRAARKNALTLAMWTALADLFETLAAEPEVRAVILSGAGGVFCAGADISEFGAARSDAASGEIYSAAVERANIAIRDCPKATYAAISGPAMGGGCGLALCCDFRFADDTAVFSIPAARLGVVYAVTETAALVETVGIETAKDILFTARRLDAAEAMAKGLVTERAEDAMAAALAHAALLRENAPMTIAGAKATLRALAGAPEPAALAEALDWQRRAVLSEDYRGAVEAFAQKRRPEFHGR